MFGHERNRNSFLPAEAHQLRADANATKASDGTDVDQRQSRFCQLVDSNDNCFGFFAQVGTLTENE